MDYFSALNIFHHVADSGSFTATAKALGIAVSSVMRQIDNLEEKLGVPCPIILLCTARRPCCPQLPAVPLSRLRAEMVFPQGKASGNA